MSRIASIVLLTLLAGHTAPTVGQVPENASPVAAFHAYPAGGDLSISVLLDATASTDPDGSIVSYQWLFGDGTTGSGAKLEHKYPRIGRFEVTLVVIDNRGASDMTTKTVDLSELEQPSGSETGIPRSMSSSPPAVLPSSAPVGNQVGDRAPDFTLPTLDGDVFRLSECLGYVVIVEFWFSTCPGCVSSLPHLAELQAQFADQGLIVVIVVLDHDPSQARDLFAEGEYAQLVAVHEHDWTRPTRTAYDVKGTPHAFLIDRSGAIRFSGKPSSITSELVASRL